MPLKLAKTRTQQTVTPRTRRSTETMTSPPAPTSVLRFMKKDERNGTTTFSIPWPTTGSSYNPLTQQRRAADQNEPTTINMENGGHIEFDEYQELFGMSDPDGLNVSFLKDQMIIRFSSPPILPS